MFTIRNGTTQDEVDDALRAFEVVRQPADFSWCETCNCYRKGLHSPCDLINQIKWEILPLGPNWLQFGGNV
jgi:hypothetical protein